MKQVVKRALDRVRNSQKSRGGSAQRVLSSEEDVTLGPDNSSVPAAENHPESAKRAEGLAEARKILCKAFGVQDHGLAEQLINQAGALQVWGTLKNDGDKILGAVGFLQEIKPAGITEALLAVQMLGVHHTALMFLKRASVDGQTFEGADANVLRATRLLRLFNEQLEVMQKLKGKAGQQKVTVEHVHVYQGGQAIVGTVNPAKTETGGGVE